MFPFSLFWAPPLLPPPSNRLYFPRSLILILLLSCGFHPNHGHSPLDPKSSFLQIKINGIQNSCAKLSTFLIDNSINIPCLQETKLTPQSSQPSFPGYNLIRKDRLTGRGGSLAILDNHAVSFVHIDTSAFTDLDLTLELLAICIKIRSSSFEIFNVDIPLISLCPPGYNPNFAALLDFASHDAIFFGDFSCLVTPVTQGATLLLPP
jgi:hypothetical protein